MDDIDSLVVAGREAYHRRDWSVARDQLAAARSAARARGGDLAGADLALLHDAAWWSGLLKESIAAGTDAHRALVIDHQVRFAAWVAIGVAVNHLLRDEDEPGRAWLGRAALLLTDQPVCPEQGFLRYVTEVEAGLDGPDMEAVITAARDIREMGQRLGDATLVACGDLGEGRALLRLGRTAEGLRLLDRAMLAVTTEKLQPEWAGDLYCHMMSACHELGDVRRARRWTEATEQWLETMPAAILFTGICRVHRAQLHQLAGDWQRAERDAAQVCRELAGIHRGTLAEAHYVRGELRRLHGDLEGAEKSYRAAHGLGRDPQPGLALLRTAQGRTTIAAAQIRAAITVETSNPLRRAALCAAHVEIALAAEDLATARTASDELTETASTFQSPALRAAALQATGAIRLAERQTADALRELLDARRAWQDLEAPYETARTRVLLAQAYLSLGDMETARWETEEATAVFRALGAAPDLQTLTVTTTPNGLTPRELDILRCLASGASNRRIASQLIISEKTVARHLANIFTKLDVSSRTAAAAFAFEHAITPRTKAPEPRR